MTYKALIKHDAGRWIGWIEEITGVNCQERTQDELLTALRTTLGEAVELNREDARNAAGGGFEELDITV